MVFPDGSNSDSMNLRGEEEGRGKNLSSFKYSDANLKLGGS